MTSPAKKTAASKKAEAGKPPESSQPSESPATKPDDTDPQTLTAKADPAEEYQQKWVDAEERAATAAEERAVALGRVAELEARLAPPPPQPAKKEMYVDPGFGAQCLEDSWCQGYEVNELGVCRWCNHVLDSHKRNPAGAVFRDVEPVT